MPRCLVLAWPKVTAAVVIAILLTPVHHIVQASAAVGVRAAVRRAVPAAAAASLSVQAQARTTVPARRGVTATERATVLPRVIVQTPGKPSGRAHPAIIIARQRLLWLARIKLIPVVLPSIPLLRVQGKKRRARSSSLNINNRRLCGRLRPILDARSQVSARR